MLDILKHPYMREFYSSEDLISSENKIKVLISDNQKLTVKEYRSLIYKKISEKN
jgi:hypothetical protein